MRKKMSKEDKREIMDITTGCVLGVIIAVVIMGAVIGGMALYSFLKYWR